ncbi:response regulator transcription factor [Flavobacterium sp.]|jgi:DNA-binding NarL/FixJ family response regulator|uniref:response regulator transcription factor n=1 Tax=Flavobacterium sp. TaxID=239 RepID=UPI00260CF6DD|nr:response regulator transcription factor [Flavobacterium sp.]
MSQTINILIVDDHQFIIQGYKNVINLFPDKSITFNFIEASDCKSGFETISNSPQPFDVAFLDVSMPEYPEKNINTGEDLAKLIKETMPECKIALLTMHSESLKVMSIIEEINPLGLVIKNDLTFDSMILALTSILNGDTYYSDSVIKFLNNQQKEKVYIDVIDRQILHYLNKGVNYDDIPLYITISSSSVKTRKENLKDLLGISGSDDASLVSVARDRGLLL